MTSVQEFYNLHAFPGPYDPKALHWLDKNMTNPYVNFIDRYISQHGRILDAGCGTGLLTNFFAQRYPSSTFTAIDFSKGIEYAEDYAKKHMISNIRFDRQDIRDLNTVGIYDTVICQGVLHHIPQYDQALERLQSQVKSQGILILGLYHPLGKILKKFINIDYGSDILHRDQEHNAYETCFTKQQILKLSDQWQLLDMWPRNPWLHFIVNPLSYSKSGGLTIYAFKQK